MSRSRNRLIRFLLPLAALVASLVLATPAFAAAPPIETTGWSPKLAYVLTTGETRAKLCERLHLTAAQSQRLRDLGRQLYNVQRTIQRRSDLICQSGSLSLVEKRELIRTTGYNLQLQSAEVSVTARIAAAIATPEDALNRAVDAVWQEDAATHRLESALQAMSALPTSVAMAGSFHVYATWFDPDVGIDPYHVALPDKYLKFANLGYANSGSTARPSGYPNGTYAVSLYWNGIHYGEKTPGSPGSVYNTPHSIASVKVLDVGPWNHDDNWWNSYSDPTRPRRINSGGVTTSDGVWHDIDGPNNLVGKTQLPQGTPESQAAYFDHYCRPSTIPAPVNSPPNYWNSPGAADGTWAGADQFGRQVLNPAGIDLTTPVARTLGLNDNEWIDVMPLWEARLDLVGGITATPGPYLTGQKVTFTYTVKNLGSLTGTWDSLRFLVKRPNGSFDYGPATGPVTLAPGASRTFSFTHTLDAAGSVAGCPDALRGGSWGAVGTANVSMSVAMRTVDRLGGATRYETAVAMSKAQYPGTAKAVVIATGLNFPDALAGAALAHAEDGPMLLVGNTLSASVEAEVKRLAPAKIIILGSTAVVSADIASRLSADVPGAVVSRLGGWNRYATARLIAQQVAAHYGGKAPNGTVIVATGRDFPDALAASVLSADKGWPIVLTDAAHVPTDTAAALSAVGATNSYVIGGTTVVYPAVLGSLPAPTRVAGNDRYETAALVGDLAETKGLSYAYVGIAVGTTYPDALAGGVLAADGWGTMLLTPRTGVTWAVRNRLAAHRTVTTHLQAYGSVDALPSATFSQAEDALR